MFYLILSIEENEECASLCTVSGINYWFTYLLNGLIYLSMLLKLVVLFNAYQNLTGRGC